MFNKSIIMEFLLIWNLIYSINARHFTCLLLRFRKKFYTVRISEDKPPYKGNKRNAMHILFKGVFVEKRNVSTIATKICKRT